MPSPSLGSDMWLPLSTCQPGWRKNSLFWFSLCFGPVSANSFRAPLCRSSVSLLGGFSVVNVKYKEWALLSQWVRRFASSPSSWSSFLSFWFLSSYGVPPSVVFSRLFSFDHRALPPFYQSLVLAWRGLNGSFAPLKNSLVIRSSLTCTPVAEIFTKTRYLYLLSENATPPHCIQNFRDLYPCLDWPATWRSLSLVTKSSISTGK